VNDTLSKLKTYLGIPEDKTDFDGVLKLIIDNTELQLKVKLSLFDDSAQVPYELSYIPLQVEVKRFNRLKNEGMTSFTQEGESITFNDNDFDEFQDDISAWKTQHNATVLKAIDPYSRRGGQS
jgi:hypothetical protein